MSNSSISDHQALAWLITHPHAEIRAMALRDLVGKSERNPDVRQAQSSAHSAGLIADLLGKMHPEGYWAAPGAGYAGKYRSTVWALITLAQMGAHADFDERIHTACQYYLSQAFCQAGQISSNGAPSGTVDCLQGNMCWALTRLGCRDERLNIAYDWMARCVSGEGIAPMAEKRNPRRFFAGKCGPLFACGANNKLPCAWGAAKVLLALAAIPAGMRTPQIQEAIHLGVEFFLNEDPATAPWPNGWSAKPSRNWWLFGFPVFYITDLLQVAEGLAGLHAGSDTRCANLFALIRSKQDANGCWALAYDYSGKIDLDFGKKNEPNPWVTLRAMRVLKQAGVMENG